MVRDVVAGSTYLFRVRALNAKGWGQYSTTVGLIPSGVPDKMSPVVTAVSGTNIKISWLAPTQTNGSPITAYQIYFKAIDGTFSLIPLFCDGANATIVSQQSCLVPMLVLRASPFSLFGGSMVVATVLAINQRGQSMQSNLNTEGAMIMTEPF
jgi:hypothetical protein